MWITNLFFWWLLRPGKIRRLNVGGLNRTYFVHVPKGYEPKKPMPVVLALHGALTNGPIMASFSGLNRKADEASFIVVYPNGTGKHLSFTWNGGNCCGSAMQSNVDDVAFMNALLDDLMGAYQVDPKRVFATGMSNGAIMVYRLASELSDRIAAIAPVAGALGIEIRHLKRPVPVLHFHGTKDEFIPFLGGKGSKSVSGTDFCSVEESIRAWLIANNCDENPKIDVLSMSDDQFRVIRTTYGGGEDGAEVVLVAIEGGGHCWPGIKSPTSCLGNSTLNISANDLMWEFFKKHPMQ